MKKIFSYSILLSIQLSALFLLSCEEEEPFSGGALSSFVSSVSPTDGFVGDEVIVEGQNINDCLIIKIEEIEIFPSFVNDDKVTFIIPENVSSGDLIVEFNDGINHKIENKGYFKIWEENPTVLKTEIEDMKCFDFLSSEMGYYTAGDHVMKTSDGGNSWKEVLNAVNSHPLYAVSEQEVWIDQVSGDLLRSQNGGDTWEQVNFDDRSLNVDKLFVADNAAYAKVSDASGEQEFLFSENGGQDWNKVLNPTNGESAADYHIVSGDDSQLMIYDAVSHKFFNTLNRLNWEIKESDIQFNEEAAGKMFFLDNYTGWALTNGGFSYTYDGGSSWGEQGVNLSEDGAKIEKIHFFNAYDGMMISTDGGVLRSKDGGITWITRHLEGQFGEVDFMDEERAAIVAYYAEPGKPAQLVKFDF